MISTAKGDAPRTCLDAGLQRLGLDLDEAGCDACIAYLDLLAEWNRAYNLTAIRQPGPMVAYHLLDSLAVLPYVRGNLCLDVGTGAGLPGLILALADRQRHWRLLDSSRKRLRFVNQVILELGISNAETLHGRVEDMQAENDVSTITLRAYGCMGRIWRDAGHLVRGDTRLLAMKGTRIEPELAELEGLPVRYRVHELTVPGLEAGRTLIEVHRSAENGSN